MTSKYTQIETLIIPAVESFNCRLYGIELVQGGKRQVVRVLLEGEAGSITIDDISRVSKQISAVLDVADIMRGGYVLEVSSPGLDRPLLKPVHYLSAIGQKVVLSMTVPVEGRKNFHGVLVAATETEITVEENAETTHHLQLSEVQKARVVPEIKVGRGQKHEQ